ncbi:uroporphyrinogen-III C-methyltransferase [Oceanisphaera pacifica]|uniref:Uroporphyrinogen-III C-methyltransferase n=1 Tax=Oceanisphaera pacifica TaxID=2818389 RepID=A0ABS3NIZ5_9GAMM|nr:uroporphyrinogen-III C-methyltransferase [Oceanisphaera pacifica]MBO1520559.1 uroporphyrinogen-III C-methyltransferase [Oceanisphaera pacifica]
MTDKTDNNQEHKKSSLENNDQQGVASSASEQAKLKSQSATPNEKVPESKATEPEPKKSASPKATVPPSSEPTKASSSGKVLAIVAIIIAIILAAVLYWHGHNQSLEQAQKIEQLQQQMSQQQQQLQDSLQTAESKQAKQLANVASQQDSLNERIEGVSRKVLDLDSKRPNDWMLAEAEYLVRMAGRKLWLEQDAVAAAMMLANADERLAAINDPSLAPIRRALASDIASIKSVKKVDREGFVIKLNSLIEQVDKLSLDGVIMARAEEPDFSVSESVGDWKDNLKKSWASFSDEFVTVRRRDGNVQALLSPQQHWYLNENLKGKLLQAQLAVYREQQEIYDSSLAQSAQWLQEYFADDSVRQAMLEQLEQLNDKQINVDYPEQLTAQGSLKQLLDDRLQRLLTGQ